MFRSFIKLMVLFWILPAFGQEPPSETVEQDSVDYSQTYGLRLGVDLSRPARTLYDDKYQGFEIMGDFRITSRLYVAAELGNEKINRAEISGNDSNPNQFEIYNYDSSGSYLKLGVDFNTYENWYGMNNAIYIGGRYAVSAFSQTLNEYRIYDSNRYWSPDIFVEGALPPEKFSGLNATWLEFLFGIKVELFTNFFAGASLRLGYLVTNKEADRMNNLWIPGFNKVTEGSNFGVGYNYYIAYLIPLYKKSNRDDTPTEQ